MVVLKTSNWQLENIETVLFDKDGTFIDLHYFWGKMTELRIKEIMRRYNLHDECFAELCLMLGYNVLTGKMLSNGITAMYSRSVIIEIFCKDLNNIGIPVIQKELEEVFDNVSKVFYLEMEKYTKPIDSAILFIRRLKENNIKVGIVTSDSLESTHLTLNHFNWTELFDVVIGRESTVETKESGVPVVLALEKLGAKPGTTVMVGDAPMDYHAAKNAGVKNAILVSTGQIERSELSHISPYTVELLSEIEII